MGEKVQSTIYQIRWLSAPMLDAPSARIIIIRIDIIVMIDIIWQQDVSQVNCLLVMNNIQQSTTEEGDHTESTTTTMIVVLIPFNNILMTRSSPLPLWLSPSIGSTIPIPPTRSSSYILSSSWGVFHHRWQRCDHDTMWLLHRGDYSWWLLRRCDDDTMSTWYDNDFIVASSATTIRHDTLWLLPQQWPVTTIHCCLCDEW